LRPETTGAINRPDATTDDPNTAQDFLTTRTPSMQRRSLAASFRDAFNGIGHVLWTQRNAKIQLGVGVVVLALAAGLKVSPRDWAVLLLTSTAVLAAEIANTAVETLVDAFCPGPSESARIAKDAAAGAVLMLAIGSVAVGLCILGPPLWRLLV
jgi:diacylglycerol kinase (ATP)